MFRIDTSERFKAPVEFTQPGEDGKRHTHTFTAIFKRVPQSYIDDALGANSTKTVDGVVADVFVGFEDVQQEAGKVLESTAENIAMLLALAGMNQAVFAAFFKAVKQGPEKN